MSAGVASLDRNQIEALVRQSLKAQLVSQSPSLPTFVKPKSSNAGPNPLLVNVSARHMHVTQEDLEVLFGPGSKLTKLKDLYQEGEFASEQLVTIIGPKNRMIPSVRILGGIRKFT